YTYEPFGYVTQTGSASTSSYKYTGREDDGSGLYYYRARYYHPRLQRFIAKDTLGFNAGDINLYSYVQNNSMKFTDPMGLWTFSIGGYTNFCGGIGGISGGALNVGYDRKEGFSISVTGSAGGGACAGIGLAFVIDAQYFKNAKSVKDLNG